MMRLPGFRYVPAKTTSEVLEHLAGNPNEVRVVAGGTDLWPNMKRRHQSAKEVVGLHGVADLRGIVGKPGEEIRLHAMTSLTDITSSALLRKHYPGLVRAVGSISSPVLRNMGTIGGNVCLDTRCTYYNQSEEWRRSINYCLKEQGEICWVATKSARCWAINASDSAPLLCAIGAKVRLLSTRQGTRELPLAELYQDDGINYLQMQRDELLSEVVLPATNGSSNGFRSTYWKLRRRGSIDYPVLGVGTALWMDGDVVADVRIFLGAVVSANPYYHYILSDIYSDKWLGSDRGSQMVRLGSLQRNGVIFALHSDNPMAPLSPLTLAWTAVNRITINGNLRAPQERITVEAAMRAITIDAAWVMGWESEIGSIRAGKKADFTVLESNPYEVDPRQLKDVVIWGTVFEGEIYPLSRLNEGS